MRGEIKAPINLINEETQAPLFLYWHWWCWIQYLGHQNTKKCTINEMQMIGFEKTSRPFGFDDVLDQWLCRGLMFVKSASAEDWDLIVVNVFQLGLRVMEIWMRNERILRFDIVVTSCLIDDEFTQGQYWKGSPRGARFLWDLRLEG